MPRVSASAVEPQVRVGTPMPPGYVFVPKGNVYVTSSCRRRTREAQRTVYTVMGAGAQAKQPRGILVPREVADEVHAAERATRADRARAVARHDAGLERHFRDVVTREFPRAPPSEVAPIVRRAMLKGSRRVGRTATLDVEVKARLAVRAHIRHQHTDYDALLRRDVQKPQARQLTSSKIEEVVKAWGGQVLSPRPQGKAKGRPPGKKTKGRAGKPDGLQGVAAVQGRETPAAQKPGRSAARTQKQVVRAAKRRQRKDRKRQERQAQGNAATTSGTTTRAHPTTSAASTTLATSTIWNRSPPAAGTAAAPICIEDDEPEPSEYNQGYGGDESDEFYSDMAEDADEDDYDSEMAEDEYHYESDTAEDDDDFSWRL